MSAFDAHRRFDFAAYRAFIDRTVNQLLNTVSSVVAIELEQMMFAGALVARFHDWLLLEPSNTKAQLFPSARVESKLAEVFPSAAFKLSISER